MVQIVGEIGILLDPVQLLKRLRPGFVVIERVTVREARNHFADISIKIVLQLRQFTLIEESAHNDESIGLKSRFQFSEIHDLLLSNSCASEGHIDGVTIASGRSGDAASMA